MKIQLETKKIALISHLKNSYIKETYPFHVQIEFFYEIIFLGISKTSARKEREREKKNLC